MNHVHQIEHTTHTPQKCQDNNMKKKIQKPLGGRLIPALFSGRGYTIDQAWE